jgi:hypothetical protein
MPSFTISAVGAGGAAVAVRGTGEAVAVAGSGVGLLAGWVAAVGKHDARRLAHTMTRVSIFEIFISCLPCDGRGKVKRHIALFDSISIDLIFDLLGEDSG